MDTYALPSLFVSQHIAACYQDDSQALIYHKLFGNLSCVDIEIFKLLKSSSSSIARDEIIQRFGATIFDSLYNAHFFVHDPGEERAIIQNWLDDRRSQIHTGRYFEALQISSSNLCNFACTYCFADTSDKRSALRTAISKESPNISLEIATTAINQALSIGQQHDRKRIAVKFLGREPLVNWTVIEQLLKTYSSNQVAWAMTTNGSLLSDKIAPVLKEHRVTTIVSLDGLPVTNNAFRIYKSGQPTFENAFNGIKTLNKHNVHFGVSSVISSATKLGDMCRFIDMLVEHGAKELELTLVMQTTTLKIQDSYKIRAELIEQLGELYEHATKKGLLVHGDWVDPFHRILSTHKFRDEDSVARPVGVGCSATQHQISLESSGDLFPCRAMSLHYGHINDLSEALQSKAYEDTLMRTFYNVPFCRDCTLEGMCQGTCLGSCEEEGDMYVPQHEYCEVYREASLELFKRLVHTRSNQVHQITLGKSVGNLECMEKI